MKAQVITTIILLGFVTTYFGYWAVRFISINALCFESILCSLATIASAMAIREQYKNYKRVNNNKQSQQS